MTEASVHSPSRAPRTASIQQRGSGMDGLFHTSHDTMSSSSTTMDSSETSTSPPRTPTSAASGPSHHSLRLHSSHSNSKLFAPLSPPPSAPLPALPKPHLIPFKPKLLPKRGLSRSPSPIVRTEQRQTYETKAIRDEIARSRRERGRLPMPEQVEQHGIAFSDDEEGSAASTIPDTMLNISTSPVDDTTVMDMKPRKQASIHRIYEPPSPTSAFNSMDGPLLLSETIKRSSSSNKVRNAERKSIMRADSEDQEEKQSWEQQPPIRSRDVSPEMAHSYSESGQKKMLNKKGSRPKTAPQKNTYSNSDVVMRELGSSADEDGFDEPSYASVMQPRLFAVKQHTPQRAIKEMQPAWADDASILDGNEGHQLRATESPEEMFEVAALRRQVEQLQMALKKQMGTKEKTLHPPLRSNNSSGDRYSFGMPTSEPRSREGSSIGIGAFKASPSSSRSFREQHLTPSFATNYGSSEQTSPSIVSSSATRVSTDRRGMPLRSPRKQPSSDYYPFYSGEDQSRMTSDTMSSIMVDESASAFVREDDSKLEELSRKIQALEAMFKISNLSPQANLSQMSFADSSRTQRQQQPKSTSTADDSSVRSVRPRRASLATISTFEGDAMSGRRSPAASAYNFNATSPYDRDSNSSTFAQSSMMMNRQNSSTSVDVGGRKGVARFIMGVGTSKGNIPRDEYGNLLPSMQVSWSRKRNEKIAKPQINAKMTVGPGRGRIVLQQQKAT